MCMSKKKKSSTLHTTINVLILVSVGALLGLVYFTDFNNANSTITTNETAQAPEQTTDTPDDPQLPDPTNNTTRTTENLAGSLTDDDPYLGAKESPIVIIEFSDYQCPFCKDFYEDTYLDLKEDYIDKGIIKYVFRDFPLQAHPQAVIAATAASCAGEQNMYWEMHDTLFENQNFWSNTTDTSQKLVDLGKSLGLNETQLKNCIEESPYEQEIANDITDALANEVKKTPTLFINNTMLVGAQPLTVVEQVIQNEIIEAAQ